MLLLAVCALARLVIDKEERRQSPAIVRFWNKIAAWTFFLSLAMAALSGIAWFAMVVVQMTGKPPADALTGHFIQR